MDKECDRKGEKYIELKKICPKKKLRIGAEIQRNQNQGKKLKINKELRKNI